MKLTEAIIIGIENGDEQAMDLLETLLDRVPVTDLTADEVVKVVYVLNKAQGEWVGK